MSSIYHKMAKVKTVNITTLTDFLAEPNNLSTPIIFKGLVKDWPICKLSTKSDDDAVNYISQFYQGMAVGTGCCDAEFEGRLFYNDDFSGFNFKRKTTDLISFFDQLNAAKECSNPNGLYLGSTNIDKLLPEFRHHNNLAELSALSPLMSIWISNQTTIAAHHDVANNIACCVAGKRRFTLFPPEQVENLYIGPLEKTPAGQPISLVNFSAPDFKKHPKFEQAINHAHIAELETGDALFLPSTWWHQVESLTPFNILINYWWQTTPNHIGAPIDALYHALLNIKSLPSAQKKAWQAMFNHYIFNDDPNAFEHIPKETLGVLAPEEVNNARMIRTILLNKLNR